MFGLTDSEELQNKIDKINACVHCGYCLSSCPTYLSTGNEGNSPRGRLYLIKDLIKGEADTLQDSGLDYLDNCLSCMACETACPSGVEYIDLLEAARYEYNQTNHNKGFMALVRKLVFTFLLPSRKLLNFMRISLRGMNYLYERFPDLPKVNKVQPKLDFEYEEIKTNHLYKAEAFVENDANSLVLNLGCVMDTLYNQVHHQTIKILNLAGYDVFVPESTCCGALASHSGEHDLGLKQREKFLAEQPKDRTVVFNSAGCAAFVKEMHLSTISIKDIAELLNPEKWTAPVSLISFEAHIEKAAKLFRQAHGLSNEETLDIVYHPACHLFHAQGINKEYLNLINLLPNVKIHSLFEAEVCCGSAGFYNLIKPKLAEKIGERKAENIENAFTDESKLKIVLSSNPGCLSQIQAHLPDNYIVMHPISLLTYGLI